MSALAVAVLAPLTGAAAVLLVRRGADALALCGAVISLAASLWLLGGLSDGESMIIALPGLPNLPLLLVAEPLTTLLSVVVATIGTLVFVYAVGYMHGETDRVRFFAIMALFLAAMQALVLAGDWILLLAAWEVIGFCSYLLISFWFQRPEVASAASRAFLYTRSADLGLYVAVFLLIGTTGSNAIATTLDSGAMSVAAGLLLLLAAMGKSAQVPLQDWLMRAMAGPTPVSALLHSATLVAAGAMLLIRAAPVLPPAVLLAVGLVGGFTAVITGLIAFAESDLKRMLAASTASQYGLMLIAVAAGVPLAALLHLVAHAAIKSSLFLGAGIFQHARGSTEFAELQGVGRARPWVFGGFVLAALSLAGLPPLSGFYSKDAVLAAAFAADRWMLLSTLALAGTLLTGAYMGRALRLVWRGRDRDRPVSGMRWMGAGLAGLVILAATLGITFRFIADRLAQPPPENLVAMLLGLVAASAGLVLGGWGSVPRLLGGAYPIARRGFAIGGGLSQGFGRPVLALAAACDRLERRLYSATLGVGHLAMAIVRPVQRLEQRLHATVLAIGRRNLVIGRWVRATDERRIDGAIFLLVAAVQAAGRYARSLQSGLIHRELAISAVATAVMLAALLAALLRN